MQGVEVSTVPYGSAVVLRPRGVLDGNTYRSLRDQIIQTALDEPRAVLVDIAGIDVPAASAWAVFSSARRHVDRWPGVPVMLLCGDTATRAAIDDAGVTRHVPVFACAGSAIDRLNATSTPRLRRRARAELPAALPSLQRARELSAEWLTTWSRTEMISTVKVVVTTLVENVLQHTDSDPGLRVEFSGHSVAVAVNDTSRAPATLREAATATGRPSGLRIVAALCRSWGNAPTTSGKTVWAVIGPENVTP
ncbi:hypothetical protein A5759_17030 [Mycobacterium sp. 852014-52144_SCH5372336]|nr:hypothetical protein A5759_17030 [Mycobacterium sp. 852014-52144_SCH5372336]